MDKGSKRLILLAVIFIFIFLLSTILNAQPTAAIPRFEITAGAGTIIYQSAFATENIMGVEVALRGGLKNPLQWQTGARLWIDPTSPEFFGRALLTHRQGAWAPMAGLELGLTGKPKFSEGSALLRETRKAMLTEAGPFYVSCYVAPLSFQLKRDWRISAAEINFGTHFVHIGRTLRLHLNVLSLAKSF